MLVGGATISFVANKIVAGIRGTNYIQELTGWSDDLYTGLFIGLNVASALWSIACNIGMKIASNKILNSIVLIIILFTKYNNINNQNKLDKENQVLI